MLNHPSNDIEFQIACYKQTMARDGQVSRLVQRAYADYQNARIVRDRIIRNGYGSEIECLATCMPYDRPTKRIGLALKSGVIIYTLEDWEQF